MPIKTFLDSVINNVDISGGSTSSSGAGGVLGSGDSIPTVGGNQIDISFLDALYAGGKLTPAARDALLTGQDPSQFGLSAYDLFYLTCGRLGSKSAIAGSCFSLVLAFSLAAAYQPGQIVTYQPQGASGVGLYQAVQAVPAGTLPTNTAYWLQLASPTAQLVPTWSSTATYPVGQIVTYAAQNGPIGLYQVTSAPPAGTLPTNATYWVPLNTPGPQALLDVDVLSPALASVSAPGSGILAVQQTSGTVLAGLIVPAGRAYKVTVSEIRPNNRGGSTPTDSNVRLVPLISEQINGDGSTTVTITPRWSQAATANNASIAAVSALSLAVRLTVTLQ